MNESVIQFNLLLIMLLTQNVNQFIKVQIIYFIYLYIISVVIMVTLNSKFQFRVHIRTFSDTTRDQKQIFVKNTGCVSILYNMSRYIFFNFWIITQVMVVVVR